MPEAIWAATESRLTSRARWPNPAFSVTGLNTAATLWSTAAVGALAGAWMWREAIAGAAIVVEVVCQRQTESEVKAFVANGPK